jgi:hypothetical protein
MPTRTIPQELFRFEGYYGSRDGIRKISFDKDKNSLRYLAYREEGFSLVGECPFEEDGRFHVDDRQSLSFSENFGNKYILVHLNGSASSAVLSEKIEPLAQPFDGETFAKKTWLPDNISISDFVAWARHSDIVPELPGYIVFDGVPYRLSDPMTAVMCLKYTRDLGALVISARAEGPGLSFNSFEFSEASTRADLEPGRAIVIGAEGRCEWRRVGAVMAFSAVPPESGRILALDSSGEPLYDSLMDGPGEIILPEGSYVGFIGQAGAEFDW